MTNRPINLYPHLHFEKLSPNDYHCLTCDAVGSNWDMSYTHCPNFQPSHGSLVAVDPPRTLSRRWQCTRCGRTDIWDNLNQEICSNPDMTPCQYCNVAVQCSGDCPGILGALMDPNIHLISDEELEEDSFSDN